MPQGALKSKPSNTKPNKPTHSSKARSRSNPTKSASNAPKNAKVAKLQKAAKKGHSGLTMALEKRLADRAGHTEMIGAKGGGVRKDLDKKALERVRSSGGAGPSGGRVKG